MERWDADQAERVLADALARPGGAELVLGALADVPGASYEPGSPRRLLHAATPPRLTVGEWTFSPAPGRGSVVEVSHTVRGVVLTRRVVPPAEAAARLGPALLAAAAEYGGESADAAQATLAGLAEALGL